MEPDDRYWSVDLPGLTEESAEAILESAKGLNLVGPSALSPKTFLTLSLDRDTVIQLASALRRAAELDEAVPSILEECDAWLAYSDPSQPG